MTTPAASLCTKVARLRVSTGEWRDIRASGGWGGPMRASRGGSPSCRLLAKPSSSAPLQASRDARRHTLARRQCPQVPAPIALHLQQTLRWKPPAPAPPPLWYVPEPRCAPQGAGALACRGHFERVVFASLGFLRQRTAAVAMQVGAPITHCSLAPSSSYHRPASPPASTQLSGCYIAMRWHPPPLQRPPRRRR